MKMRIRKRWVTLLVLVIALFGFKFLSDFRSRPSALYSRWIGGEVPADVSNLKGGSKFYLTESIAFLSFSAPLSRIEAIVKEHGMYEVIPRIPWHVQVNSRWVEFDGSLQSTNWFELSGWKGAPSLPEDLRVFWVGHDGSSETFSGWVLYYSQSSGEAFLDSVSI